MSIYKINKKINKNYIKNNNLYSNETEQSIISSIILSNNKIYEVLEIICSNDFYYYNNKIIFEEINNIFNDKKPIDIITLSESLKKKDTSIDYINYLSEICKKNYNISNIIHYCNIVKEKSIYRKIIIILNEIISLCCDPKELKIKDILDIIEKKIFKISENLLIKKNGPQNINNSLFKIINNINNNKNIGISTGYTDLDKKILGFQKSDLIILASRPSMGKTTFAINLCEYSILKKDKPVLIFSLEMSTKQILIKLLSSLSKINQTNIKTGNLNNIEIKKIQYISNILKKKNNLYIDDSSSLTINEIKTRSKKIYEINNGISLIVIDYLQLISTSSLYNNRTLEVTEISKSLKSLAKELKVPVIALSQLNRSLEQRINKRPINSDLRESGSIEQDADLIMFIYRDDIYNNNTNYNKNNIAEIIIGKHRNGPTGSIKLFFNGYYSKFSNYNE